MADDDTLRNLARRHRQASQLEQYIHCQFETYHAAQNSHAIDIRSRK